MDKKGGSKRGKNDASDTQPNNLIVRSLWGDEEASIDSLKTIKRREAKLRTSVELYSHSPVSQKFPSILLPNRWESLQKEAKRKNVLLQPLIKPVPDAIASVNRELRQIQETGMGRLYVINGVAGSGKTTFLNSLQFFLDDIDVHTAKGMNLDNKYSVEKYLAGLKRRRDRNSVVILEGREAPASINGDFRRDTGNKTLFVIPTTYPALAKTISERAATIGGMTSMNRPFYLFEGPPRSQYLSIANETVTKLNDSRTLRDYGVSDEIATQLAQTAPSIGGFLTSCYEEVENGREKVIAAEDIIAARRKRIHLWMAFCTMEKDPRKNYQTIRSLTIGHRQDVQVERILAGDSEEARYWQEQEGAFAVAAQYLDLRLIYLPVRTANAIVTAYGDKEFISYLKTLQIESGDEALQREAVRATALESLEGTAIGAFLRGEGFRGVVDSRRPVTEKQQTVFREIVKKASKDDKSINATIAAALRAWNKNPDAKVYTELSLNDTGSLTCDIGIVTPTDIFCLEMKWRSSELYDSEIIRETCSRVRDYTRELPEFKKQVTALEQ